MREGRATGPRQPRAETENNSSSGGDDGTSLVVVARTEERRGERVSREERETQGRGGSRAAPRAPHRRQARVKGGRVPPREERESLIFFWGFVF